MLPLLMLAGLLTVHDDAGNQAQGEDARVRALVQRVIDAWGNGDGAAFAATFAEDADFVTFGGDHLQGREAIETLHQQLFDTFLKGSHLEGQVESVRFPAPGVAVAIAKYGIVLPGQSGVVPERDSMQTFVAVKRDGEWEITAFQNTRVQPPIPGVNIERQPPQP